MYSEAAWALVSWGTQIWLLITLDPDYLPDNLFVSTIFKQDIMFTNVVLQMTLVKLNVNKWLEAVRRCSVKKVFLQISQNLQVNACARVSIWIKLQAQDLKRHFELLSCISGKYIFITDKTSCLRSATSLKKRLWHRSFPVNSFKFLGTPFYIEHLWWLLLNYAIKFHNILTKGPEQSDWTSYSLGCYDSVIYQGIKENKGKTNKDIELTWLNQLEENMLQKTFW